MNSEIDVDNQKIDRSRKRKYGKENERNCKKRWSKKENFKNGNNNAVKNL